MFTKTKKGVKTMKNMIQSLGPLSFALLVALAVVMGLFVDLITPAVSATLIILLALIVGFSNITQKEIVTFLIAVVAIVLMGATLATMVITSTMPFATVFGAILANLVLAFAVVGVVVGLLTVFKTASKK